MLYELAHAHKAIILGFPCVFSQELTIDVAKEPPILLQF